MKLSVIIPVYNVEKYIEKCIISLLAQTLPQDQYELIFINDGSQDASVASILKYQNLHKNIILLNQLNQGVSSARNKGLECAKGRYITFVDSDDSIYENSLEKIIEYADHLNLDILYLNIKIFDENSNFLNEQHSCGLENVVNDGFTHDRRPFPGVIYTKKVIGEITFNTNISVGEDSVFNAMVQARAKKCSYFSAPYYKYTYRLDSLSKQGQSERAFNGFLEAIAVLTLYRKQNFVQPNAMQLNYFNTIISIFVTRIIELSVLPTLEYSRYSVMMKMIKELKIDSILIKLKTKFPFIGSSSFVFFGFQKIVIAKKSVYLIAHKTKKILKN